MNHMLICLLTLLFSLSGPAMGEHSDFGHSLLAAKTTEFAIHPRVLGQLENSRLGDLAGKLKPSDLQRLLNEPGALRVRDLRPDNFGNINVIQNVEGKLLRITVPGNEFKVISVGPIRPNQVNNLLESGGFQQLP